ncbi:MAG: tetratricopeptide repeat protein, partial [Rubripirellula sp.]
MTVFLSPNRWVPKVAVILLAFLCISIIGCGDTRKDTVKSPETPPKETPKVDAMTLARQALAANDTAAADAYLRDLLLAEPDNVRALEMCSEVALKRGDVKAALSLLDTAISKSDSPSRAMLSKAAEVAMACGQPFESIRFMVQVNELVPLEIQPKYDLIGLSAMVGMTQVALPPLKWLAQRGEVDFESLQVLANPIRVQPDEEACKNSLERCPDDLRAHYGLAVLEATKLDWQAVLDRLAPVLEKHPDFAPAFSLYGRALLESGKYESIPAWQKTLPKNAQDNSQYWVVAGLWAQHQGNPGEAAHAFLQALKTDMMVDPRGLQGLASSLDQLGRTKEAEQVSQYLTDFAKMGDALETHLDRDSRSQAAAAAVAELMVPLGRIWEAEAWMRLAVPLPENRLPEEEFRKRYLAIRSQLTVKTPWQLP